MAIICDFCGGKSDNPDQVIANTNVCPFVLGHMCTPCWEKFYNLMNHIIRTKRIDVLDRLDKLEDALSDKIHSQLDGPNLRRNDA